MARDIPTGKFLVAWFKAVALFFGALYLLGFSFNGVNVLGAVDALIPFERVMCFIVSCVFWVWFGWSVKSLFSYLYNNKSSVQNNSSIKNQVSV